MEDAIEMARDAIALTVVTLEDHGEIVPEPSKMKEINILNGAFISAGEGFASLVDADITEYRRKIDTKPVRRNRMDYIVNINGVDVLIEDSKGNVTDAVVDRLLDYRRELKLTQQDIADATGIMRPNIARLEAKKGGASLETLVRYADALGMRLNISLEKKEKMS